MSMSEWCDHPDALEPVSMGPFFPFPPWYAETAESANAETDRVIREIQKITDGVWDDMDFEEIGEIPEGETESEIEATPAEAEQSSISATTPPPFRDCRRGLHNWNPSWKCTGCGISEYDHQLLKGGA